MRLAFFGQIERQFDGGTPYSSFLMNPQVIKHSFKSACRDAAVLNLTFHDLCHTFGTLLADAGVDIVKIAELMGHESILTTRRYTHATDEGKRAAGALGSL